MPQDPDDRLITDLLASYLARRDEGTAEPVPAFLAAHPDQASALAAMLRELEGFEDLCQDLRRPIHAPGRQSHALSRRQRTGPARWLRPAWAAAAALVLVVAMLQFLQPGTAGARPAAGIGLVLEELLGAVLVGDDSPMEMLEARVGSGSTGPGPVGKMTKAQLDQIESSLWYIVVDTAELLQRGTEDPGATPEQKRKYLAAVRALTELRTSRWGDEVPPSLIPFEPLPVMAMLLGQGLPDDESIRQGLPPQLAAMVDMARQGYPLQVRAVDLDQDGSFLAGADVYLQESDLRNGRLGPPVLIGRTPLDARVQMGDYRLTVVDAATGRFSELRTLVLPGNAPAREVAFLRHTAPLAEAMVYQDPCSIPYGTPPGLHALHYDEQIEAVSGFFIDPFEVTNDQFKAFAEDVLAHPEWFGGRMPVARPYLFDEDWNLPPGTGDLPVLDVSWGEAVLCANWLGKRLPADREWERAAQGPEGRRYPWGDVFDASRVDGSFAVTGAGRYTSPADGEVRWGPVDDPEVASGATPDGLVWRLGDNAREWVEDIFLYPLDRNGGGCECMLTQEFHRAVRGGCWQRASAEACRVDMRVALVAYRRMPMVGFRCAKSAAPLQTR